MRSADAAEKATRKHPEFLGHHKKELLGRMTETEQQELRWHLAVMVPRLSLNAKERRVVFAALNGYLGDCSSIVKTFALQGLADLTTGDPALRGDVMEILRQSARSGTAAMKARSRKLLGQMEKITLR
jgi:hypothetical protein